MKNIYFKIFTVLLVITNIIASCQVVCAQELKSFILPSPLSKRNLQGEQKIRFNKLESKGQFSLFEFVNIGKLADYQQNSKLKLVLSLSNCPNLIFKAKRVEYQSDSNYSWCGELIDDTINSNCVLGEIQLVKTNGDLIGHFNIDEQIFELYDLTGGLFVIAKVNKIIAAEKGCSMNNLTVQTNTAKTTGWNCKVRLLVLYTPAAFAAEPNMASRINLAYQQVKSGLYNSKIFTTDFDLVLAGSQQLNFVETNPTLVASNPIASDLTSVENNTTAQALRSQYAADIVILLTKGNYGSITGIATDATNLILDAAHAYAIVQTDWATTDGYTFAHEFGHICGGRHQNDPTPGTAHAKIFQINQFLWKKERRTIISASSAGLPSVILYYSNPNINYKGTATGDINNSNNANQLRTMGCTLASYQGGNEPFSVSIAGNGSVCPCNMAYYSAIISGPPTPYYNFEWAISNDGISYSIVGTSVGYYFKQSCSFQNSPTHLRLKVTDPIGQVRYDFLPILNDTCSISYGYPCNTHGVYFGPLFRKNNENTEDLIPSIIYPNPANDELSIHFYAESNNQVKFTFINTLGEECKTFIPNNIIEGINTEKISTINLPQGVYTIQIAIGKRVENRKLVLLK